MPFNSQLSEVFYYTDLYLQIFSLGGEFGDNDDIFSEIACRC